MSVWGTMAMTAKRMPTQPRMAVPVLGWKQKQQVFMRTILLCWQGSWHYLYLVLDRSPDVRSPWWRLKKYMIFID